MLRLAEPRSGRVHFDGRDLTAMHGDELRRMRRHLQMVFQDAIASLNARV